MLKQGRLLQFVACWCEVTRMRLHHSAAACRLAAQYSNANYAVKGLKALPGLPVAVLVAVQVIA